MDSMLCFIETRGVAGRATPQLQGATILQGKKSKRLADVHILLMVVKKGLFTGRCIHGGSKMLFPLLLVLIQKDSILEGKLCIENVIF